MNLEDLKKEAHSREIMLAVFFCLALLFMFLRIFYWPPQAAIKIQLEKVQSMEMEKQALEKFAAATSAQLQENAFLITKPTNIKMQILSGKKTSPTPTLPLLLKRITEPDFIRLVDIDLMSQSAKVLQNGYSKTPFIIKAHSSFDSIMDFVDRLDGLEALMALDTLSLSIESQRHNEVNVELAANLYQLEDVHAPATPTKK